MISAPGVHCLYHQRRHLVPQALGEENLLSARVATVHPWQQHTAGSVQKPGAVALTTHLAHFSNYYMASVVGNVGQSITRWKEKGMLRWFQFVLLRATNFSRSYFSTHSDTSHPACPTYYRLDVKVPQADILWLKPHQYPASPSIVVCPQYSLNWLLVVFIFLLSTLTWGYVYWFERERKGKREDGRERGEERSMGCLLYASRPGIKPTTFVGVWVEAPTNWATWPGRSGLFLLVLSTYKLNELHSVTHSHWPKRFYLLIFRGEGEEKEERNIDVWDTSTCCLSYIPTQGPDLQVRHVPWLGIEPVVTFWLAGLHSIHWATLVRAKSFISRSYCFYSLIKVLLNIQTLFLCISSISSMQF